MECVHTTWRRAKGVRKDRAGGSDPWEVWAKSCTWQGRGSLHAQGSEYSSPMSLLHHQGLGHGRFLVYISRRNDCQQQLPSSSPLRLATTMTRDTLLWLFQVWEVWGHIPRRCFILRVVPVQERPWVHGSLFCESLSWQLLYTFTAMAPPHVTILKNLTTIWGHQKYFKHIHEVSDKIAPKKESDYSFPTWPSQDTKHSIFLWEVRKTTVTFNTSMAEALLLAPLLSWQCT